MDLSAHIHEVGSLQREAFSWIMSAGWPPSVVIAMGSPLRLLSMGQLLVRASRLRAAVTTEAEALANVRLHRPALLFCSDGLEEGSIESCILAALQEVPQMRVLLCVEQRQRALELRRLEPLLDAVILEGDMGSDEKPLRTAFISLARRKRYRSPSLRQVWSQEPPPPIPALPGVERLTAREEEVLQLISQGLQDRQIGAALGLSHETARTYVKTVRRKLGGGSRLAASARRWEPLP